MMMPTHTLATLKPGQTAMICSIHADELLQHRLQALGLRVGKHIEVIRQSNFSGPIQIRVGTTDLMMRPSEASHIGITLQ